VSKSFILSIKIWWSTWKICLWKDRAKWHHWQKSPDD